jgi:Endosomal/lysosomal potassium channel TMEM175
VDRNTSPIAAAQTPGRAGNLGGWAAMTTDFRPVRWRDDLPSVERLLSLSDNVIAFALTLLVLQVTVPPLSQAADPTSAAELATRLTSQAGHLASYVFAFYIVASFG